MLTILARRWFQIFASGLVLLFLTDKVLVSTSNPNYIPSVILLGDLGPESCQFPAGTG